MEQGKGNRDGRENAALLKVSARGLSKAFARVVKGGSELCSSPGEEHRRQEVESAETLRRDLALRI